MVEPSSTSNIDRLAEMYDATADRAFASTTLMAPDIEWHEPEGLLIGGTYYGPDAVHEVLSSVLKAFDEPLFTTERYVGDGDTVIVFGTFTGTHRKTGKSIEIPNVHVWEFEDGTVIEFSRYSDTARFNWAFDES